MAGILNEIFDPGLRVDLGAAGHLDVFPAGDAVAEHGFTGTDKRGVKWVDGKEVKSGPDGGGTQKKPAGKGGGVDVGAVVGKVVDTAIRTTKDAASSKVVGALGKAGKWLVDSTVGAFRKLEKRYGRAGAVAIAASSQALSWGAFLGGPAIVGFPLYIPSAVAAAPGAAIAEAVKLFKGKPAPQPAQQSAKEAAPGVPTLSGEDVERLARAFVSQVTALWRKVAGEGTPAAEPAG